MTSRAYRNTEYRDVERAKEEANRAGNWRKWPSYAWFDQPDDAEAWAQVSVGMNRDADCLARSNHRVARDMLEGVDPEQEHWTDERASHWGVGWVEGFAIRCLDSNGEPTAAWVEWIRIEDALDAYPVLDESDWSDLESEQESEEWQSYGRDDFRRALSKHFGSECVRYPDGALDFLWGNLVQHHCDNGWHDGDGFDLEGVLSHIKEGDLRIALDEYRQCERRRASDKAHQERLASKESKP